jgi:hypothetical protein
MAAVERLSGRWCGEGRADGAACLMPQPGPAASDVRMVGVKRSQRTARHGGPA